MIIALVGEKGCLITCLLKGRDDSSSVVSPLYTMKPRVYLNDHNEPRPLNDLGMKQPDFQKCQVLGIKY